MIDMRTVLFSYIISNSICTVVIAALWAQNRKRFAGLGLWLADFIIQFAALLLSMMRGVVPDLLSMVVSTTMIIGGTVLLFMGLEQFVKKQGKQNHNIILLAFFFLIHVWFTNFYPSLDARNINLSLGLLAICSQGAWLMLRRVDLEMRPVTRDTGLILLAYCLISFVRIIIDLTVHSGNDLFHSNVYDTLIILLYQMFFIVLTFTLVLMVNHRLVANLEDDISKRGYVEEALKKSEEKFFKAFHASPDAVLISRMSDGRYVEVNEGFSNLTGYSREEALTSSSIQLGMWANPEDRVSCITALSREHHLRNCEYDFRTKSGEILNCQYSGEIIELNGETHILSVIRDITEQKQMNDVLRRRTEIIAALHQVTLDLINRHELNDILRSLLAQTRDFLKASDISIDLLEDDDTIVTRAATSASGQYLKTGDVMRRGEGGWLSWQAVDSGQPAVLADYSNWEKRRPIFDGYPIHAIMIVPILNRGKVVGTINISRNEEKKPFGEMDIYAAQQLAQMAALVLDNAELYSRLQSELVDRKRIESDLLILSRAVDQSQISIIITDTSGAIEYVNPKFTELTGYGLDEVRGKNPRILRTKSTALETYQELWGTILAGRQWHGEFHNRKKSGELYWDASIISPIVDEQGVITHFVAIKEDVTERKRTEQALLKLAAIEERQRMGRDLHDSVNQSIHSLVLFSETLVSTLEKNNIDRAGQIVGRLQESARQALKETRLMLYEFQPSGPERSADFIRDLETRLATVERHAGVKAQIIQEGSMEYCPQEWCENLFWITIEALNNALKHAQSRNVQVFINCSPEYLILEIVDDGRGFDPDRQRSGGLGLRNMRERAGLLGGELTIDSAPEEGSKVRFHAAIHPLEKGNHG